MARKKQPKKNGRPEIAIDPRQFGKLGAMFATLEQVAMFFNCTKRTIINRLKDPELLLAFEHGKERGKMSLRQLQWRHARGSGSSAVNMTIHMSKHHLGETDKSLVEMSGPGGGPIQTEDMTRYSDDELQQLESIQRAADARRSKPRADPGGD